MNKCVCMFIHTYAAPHDLQTYRKYDLCPKKKPPVPTPRSSLLEPRAPTQRSKVPRCRCFETERQLKACRIANFEEHCNQMNPFQTKSGSRRPKASDRFVHIYARGCVYVSVFTHVHIYIYTHIQKHAYTCTYVYICIHIHLYMC